MAPVLHEGFDRSQIEALMNLQRIEPEDRPELTDRLLTLEADFANIRAKAREREHAKQESERAAKTAQAGRKTHR